MSTYGKQWALVPVTVITPTVDFTSLGTTDFDMPLVAGKRFYPLLGWLIVDPGQVGTATTNLVAKLGNNASHDNVFTVMTWTSGGINGARPSTPATQLLMSSNFGCPDLSTTKISFEITQAPAGMTTLTGKISLFGYYQ